MRSILLLGLSSLIITASVRCQSSEEVQVAGCVERLRTAMISADKTALENLAAEKLSYGHSNGLVQDKTQFIDDLLKGKSVFKTMELSEQHIYISGDLAIVRHHLTADTNNDRVPGHADLFVLLIWQKEGSGWQLLARQAVKNPASINK
ncbi:MAG TPA: nuclear transport factor 2 family protein [Puia sp.]|nr:nuclear transport factor 2 family protein [Puia sp.]